MHTGSAPRARSSRRSVSSAIISRLRQISHGSSMVPTSPTALPSQLTASRRERTPRDLSGPKTRSPLVVTPQVEKAAQRLGERQFQAVAQIQGTKMHLGALCALFLPCSTHPCQASTGTGGRHALVAVVMAKVSAQRSSVNPRRISSSSISSTRSWCPGTSLLAITCCPSVGIVSRHPRSGRNVQTSPSPRAKCMSKRATFVASAFYLCGCTVKARLRTAITFASAASDART